MNTTVVLQLSIMVISCLLFFGCSENATPLVGIIGTANHDPDMAKYTQVFYVADSEDGEDHGEGTKSNPWTSIHFALKQIPAATAQNQMAILIANGTYSEHTLLLKPHVSLYGGYDADTWERDIGQEKTILSGDYKRRIAVGAEGSVLDGFVLSAGQVRGNGAALYCDGIAMHVTNNTFITNKTLGPSDWKPKYWHETAHDGGAVYATNGANLIIEGNHFIKNYTDNGRGAAVACDHRSQLTIKNNVFFQNAAGLNDPMRSSDGGAISVFRWSRAHIEQNIILGNKALSNNDGGGIFIALWSSASLNDNYFVDNEAGDDAGAVFVGGQEHRYDAPLDPLPPPDSFFVNLDRNLFIGNRNSSSNSGAMRFTMESRGRFSRNIVAQNNGIFFQRSEVEVNENIILDDMLFLETKTGLKPGHIHDNIIWAQFNIDTEARIENNNLKFKSSYPGNYSNPPKFKNDGLLLPIASAVHHVKKQYSTLTLFSDELIPGMLRNRIVKSGKKWSIIRDNTANSVTLWGGISAVTHINILPTYTLKRN